MSIKLSFSEKQLTQALSLQYRSGDLKDNGMAVIERLEKAFSAFVLKLEEQVHLNIEQLKGEYEDLGLTEESAYLGIVAKYFESLQLIDC